MAQSSTSPRSRRAAGTTEQLLAAAREVFESRGYAATTVGLITQAASTAHGTFYLYFKNKEDVFSRVMEQVGADLFAHARAPWVGDPHEQLVQAIGSYLDVFAAHRGLWRCLMEGMHRSPAIERLWLDLRRPFIDRITRDIERLQSTGLARPVDPVLAAESLGSMVEWTTLCWVEYGEPKGRDTTTEELARTLADLWYHAIAAPPSH